MKEQKLANKQETLHCCRSVPQILLDTAENNEIHNSKLHSNQTIEQNKLFLSDSILNKTKKLKWLSLDFGLGLRSFGQLTIISTSSQLFHKPKVKQNSPQKGKGREQHVGRKLQMLNIKEGMKPVIRRL